MSDAMSRAEESYLAEPEHYQTCECGTKMRNGTCPWCDAPDYDPDERD